METLRDEITVAQVFAGLDPRHLELIAGCGRNIVVPSDTYLLREGEPADTFYLIRRGSVALEVHSPTRGAIVIETLRAGDAVGLSWLFAPYRWQLDARTKETCHMIALDGACLRGKCDEDHELGYELMRRFASDLVQRLQATRMQLLDLYGDAQLVD